jgi:6-phosphogluconolactonase/glucosamine-6-phosphate isomerase/deaminase
MQFISSSDWNEGITALTRRIDKELANGKKVLWLVSGGSNIRASVEIMSRIAADLTSNLTVGLIDERYGPAGHDDSNWHQLEQAGFEPKHAAIQPVLIDLDAAQTALQYEQHIKQAVAESAIVIAQIGMGADGHVAGILPGSAAADEQTAWVKCYESSPHTRITLTFEALKEIDAAYVFAFGESKQLALSQLKNEDIPLTEQPAQILKQLPEVYVYTDQTGDVT